MTEDDKQLKYEHLPDGSLSVEMPGDGSLAACRVWLEQHCGYAKVQLSDCKGRFMNIIDAGPSFVWRDGERTNAVPRDEAIRRFGRPRLLTPPTLGEKRLAAARPIPVLVRGGQDGEC